jgi:hypothetical protein
MVIGEILSIVNGTISVVSRDQEIVCVTGKKIFLALKNYIQKLIWKLTYVILAEM